MISTITIFRHYLSNITYCSGDYCQADGLDDAAIIGIYPEINQDSSVFW